MIITVQLFLVSAVLQYVINVDFDLLSTFSWYTALWAIPYDDLKQFPKNGTDADLL